MGIGMYIYKYACVNAQNCKMIEFQISAKSAQSNVTTVKTKTI